MQYPRNCIVCGAKLAPFREETLTAHEFNCYKQAPDKVPEHHKQDYNETLAWEMRSMRAKLAASKRRKAR